MTEAEKERAPRFIPAHKMPAWLSSEDVKEEIVKLAQAGADKAVCWDMMQAIYRLTSAANLREETGNG